MRALRRPLLLVLAAATAAPALVAAGPAPAPAPRVVVAIPDSGINPYHEAFQVETSSVTPDVLAELEAASGEPVVVVDLGRDFFDDEDFWLSVEPDTDYHFLGTNIVARSFSPGSIPILPDDEGDTHGVGVAHSVAIGNPEAVLYFHEGTSSAASTHAFQHPAVDIVTTSYGFVTGAPGLPNLGGSYEGVVTNGKIHAGAATNDPSLVIFDGTSGPWWSIGVAGIEEGSSGGKQVFSGTFPDVVADFTQDLAYCMDCSTGTEEVGGTSFATPLTAGILSDVVLEARRTAGHVGGIRDGLLVNTDAVKLSTWDVRRAFEEGTVVPGVGTGDPVDYATDFVVAAPVNPLAPYAQVGWGQATVDPAAAVVDETLAHLGFGEPSRTKSAATCDWMLAHFDARVAYWSANLLSDGFASPADADAYLRC